MIKNYKGMQFVVDPEIDFIMQLGCYEAGCNCSNCQERVFDGCVIDEVNIEDVMEYGE